ncbi:hypothetical protein D9X30_4850 [Cupriavidus sp. U2]|uniref:hypothetical protein n=1 Tax=Cupriavidus sp. U2 TaxID=2920269 RepID=UPI00129EBC4F|nr:hypothetical protein [Cupriavidus sp. U2]KAI3590242.1 hypothetical protein D9X30_4850 [Cupriavidus sp. U2]
MSQDQSGLSFTTLSGVSVHDDPRGYLAAHGLTPDKDPTPGQALGLVRAMVNAMGMDRNDQYRSIGSTIHFSDPQLPPHRSTIKAAYAPIRRK